MTRPTSKGMLTGWGLFLLITAPVTFAVSNFVSQIEEKPESAIDDVSLPNVESLMMQVLELNRKEQHQKAIDLLLGFSNTIKENAFLESLLIQTFDLFLEKQVKNAQADIQKNSKDKNAYERMAKTLEVFGDDFHAMEILLHGIAHNPRASVLWMLIAKLELKANREMEALDVFREVIRLDQKNGDAYNNAAYILATSNKCNKNDLDEAKKLAEIAGKIDPKNPEYIDTLAKVHLKKGNQNLARNLMQKAIKLAPKENY